MTAGAHSHGHTGELAMANFTKHYDPAYFTHPEHTGLLAAHILIMVLAWVFILPVGAMLSLSRSRYSLVTNVGFLIVNSLGLLFGSIYNASTPDLYDNNAHHKIGWVLTALASSHVVLSFLPAKAVKAVAPTPPTQFYRKPEIGPSSDDYRYSRDSGQGTEPPSPRNSSLASHSRTNSDLSACYGPHQADLDDDHEDHKEEDGLLGNHVLDRLLSSNMRSTLLGKLASVGGYVFDTINRVILILGFVALSSGFVTYFGFFKGHGIFSGLAHFVKGGVFFWYGLLVLGRYMGSFADLGWSWNLKPDASIVGRRKAATPSAEFVESFLIFFYGSTNVFLEHLGNWGKEWSASDMEHVSITIMFLGGGLCGILVESRHIRKLLNSGLTSSSSVYSLGTPQEVWQEPKSYGFSLNPLPGLVIMLLGLMMSSHHQESMVSTMLHKQWGTLLVGAALARGVTYLLLYISPPTSYLPSRPPSELVVAFCLISGGLMFMGSAADVVEGMERFDLNAMFLFTVMMGLTCLLMAWEIVVLAIKGWAAKVKSADAMSSA